MSTKSIPQLSSLPQEHVAHFKETLDLLECPYTSHIEAPAVTELFLSPGEDRREILTWLFSRFHPDAAEFLSNIKQTKPETQLQKLLTVAHSMCLCAKYEMAVVKGDCPLARQLSFCTKLLEIVCMADIEHINSYGRSSNSFVDYLAGQEDIFDPKAWKINLIPKDLQAEAKRVRLMREQEVDVAPSVPDLSRLIDQSESLSEELDQQNKFLEDLQKTVSVQKSDKISEVITMSQMLSTVVRELRQLLAGFSHSYQASLGVWCQRKPPQLSPLGGNFKRVHGLMEKFITLFEDVSCVRQLHSELANRNIGGEFKHQMMVQASRNMSESFQKCLSILEETLHRTESNFTSQFPDLVSV